MGSECPLPIPRALKSLYAIPQSNHIRFFACLGCSWLSSGFRLAEALHQAKAGIVTAVVLLLLKSRIENIRVHLVFIRRIKVEVKSSRVETIRVSFCWSSGLRLAAALHRAKAGIVTAVALYDIYHN